ncbi:MAG: hypothetical protein ACLSX2_01235 [Christensenellaceae bacterium]
MMDRRTLLYLDDRSSTRACAARWMRAARCAQGEGTVDLSDQTALEGLRRRQQGMS